MPADVLYLSREGVFPIVRDADGRPLPAATGLPCSGTIQGEGKLCGVPSLFIRLQGCNLRCLWQSGGAVSPCDTAHASFHAGGRPCSVAEVLSLVDHNIGRLRHVVVTGGEPLLQAPALLTLCRALKQRGLHLTLETNGTLYDDALCRLIDLLSISPKLSSSDPTPAKAAAAGVPFAPAAARHAALRVNIDAIARLVGCARECSHDVQLKFVVATAADADEIRHTYIDRLPQLSPADVLVMPLGTDPATMHGAAMAAVGMATAHGWRYSPRLHVDLFGNREGV